MGYVQSIKIPTMDMKWTRNRVLKITFITLLIGIAVLSLIPPSSGIELGPYDKVNHLMAYFILSLNLGMLSLSIKKWIIGALMCVLYGVLIEFFQGFVPGRDPSVYDAVVNSLGIGLGMLSVVLFQQFRS